MNEEIGLDKVKMKWWKTIESSFLFTSVDRLAFFNCCH